MLDVRRRLRRLALLFVAGFFSLMALVFCLVGIFLWLSKHMPDWQAAFIVALAVLTIALIFIIIAGRTRRRKRPVSSGQLQDEFQKLADSVLPSKRGSSAEGAWQLVGAATLIGIIIGRSTRK